ncbi:MAG: LysM peptidoglycan-binding domain-containing protein [Ilumatobacter sp.]|uniref:LysM peptidoglycan-binding domain-containing protein n=1 Tax=Ilumatobacter sp. TaxID=1967498 RepID=UPI00391A3814
MNRLRALTRGVASLAALAALLVGLPVLLASWGRLPGSPSSDWWDRLSDTAVSDTTVFVVLTLAAWVAWATFAAAVIVEFVAGIRGFQAPRVAFAWPFQRSARTLVAGVLLMLSLLQSAGPSYASVPRAAATASTATPVSFGHKPPHPGHVIAITIAPDGTSADTSTPDESAPPAIPQDTAPVIEVERGDSPWSLAEAHLDDGLRWRELYEINRGLPQPDGRSWTNPELIMPGWQLRLPSAANLPTPQSPIEPTDAADVVHVVQRGDTLSSIADQYLGDPSRYPELFEANCDRIQPDGRRLTDPDLIVVGWNLVIPATQEPAEVEPVDAPAEPDQTTDVGEPDDSPAATPTTATTPPPTTATPAPSTTTPQPPPPTTAPAPAVTVPNPHTDTEAATSDHGGSPAPILVGLAGATALSTGLALRLRWLRRRRATRGSAAAAVIPSDAEIVVVAAADVPLVRWAGQEMATLIRDLDPRKVTGAPLAVELSEEAGIEILWDAPQHSPTVGAWRAADGGWAWRLDYDPESPVPPDELPAGIPALVTIGQREGRQLLIDLEAFGTLSVTGPPDCTSGLLRSVALELACGNDLADAYVSIVDIDVDPLVAPRHRLTVQTLTEAIEAAENAIDSVSAAMRHDSRADSFRARVGGGAPIEATVIVASGRQGSMDATFSPRRGAALVIASDRASIGDGGARIEISGDGTSARIEPLGIDFTPVRLDASTADALAAATVAVVDLPEVEPDTVDPSALGPHARVEGVSSQAQPTIEPFIVNSHRLNGHEHDVNTTSVFTVDLSAEQTTDDAHSNALGEPNTESDGRLFATESTGPELVVRVLGVPSIPDRPDIGRRELILAVLLACRGGTLAASAAQDALWGGKPVEPKTVWNFVAAVRRALGDFDDGTPVMPAADRARGTLRVHPRVTTDLDLLRRAVAAADEMSSTEAMSALRHALSMVEGPPFDAVGYDWAHRDQDVAEAARVIEQAVDRLVALSVEAGQHDLARHAISRGLRGLPGDEHLYRLRMRLEAHAGNTRGLVAAYEELCVYLADLEVEPSPATTALYNELRSQRISSTVS